MLRSPRLIAVLAWAVWGLVAASTQDAWALDRIMFRRDGREQQISGKLLVTAQDGGMLLLAADGELWTVEPEELIKRTSDDTPFKPFTAEQIAASLQAEMPEGFETLTTAHYVICYNTSRPYAQWCGALFERLYRASTNFWARKRFKISDPEMPLVALVFADVQSYERYSKDELGDAARSVVGYYSVRSNRITMYDLTGIQALRQPGSRRSSILEINQMLSSPTAEPMVATIIHEATHQIVFNCGLQSRYTDIPLWVAEGLAVYFESPDLKSAKGWRGIGTINHRRLDTFQRNLAQRPAGSLAALIADDTRMRDPRTAPDAYAEAWALNYYLMRFRSKEYLAYLRMLSQKNQLVWDDPATRLAEFRKFIGNPAELETDFLRNMRKLQ